MVADIAKMRGRPVAMFAHAALLEWDADGRMRNISVTSRLEDEADRLAATPHEAMLQAALGCSDVDEFLRRLVV